METERKTLLDILPVPNNQKEVSIGYQEAYKYLMENGMENTTSDEVMFISLLTRFIDVFSKAKSMVAQGKFTVDYKPPEPTTKLDLNHFYIVPIKKKDE